MSEEVLLYHELPDCSENEEKGEHIVKLKLKPGDHFDFFRSRPDEEGYSKYGVTITHEGYRLCMETETGGQDCDGPITNHSVYYCDLDETQVLEKDGIKFPKWEEDRSAGSVTDVYAKQMGY